MMRLSFQAIDHVVNDRVVPLCSAGQTRASEGLGSKWRDRRVILQSRQLDKGLSAPLAGGLEARCTNAKPQFRTARGPVQLLFTQYERRSL